MEEFEWLPGAPEAVCLLASASFFLAVVSNQRGVALGVTKESTLRAIEECIQHRLALLGCSIDVFRYCRHGRDEGCRCRKPRPGMLLDLASQHGIDLARSWMIGDDERDVAAGRAAGCMTARITSRLEGGAADIVVASLLDASRIIAGAAGPEPPS